MADVVIRDPASQRGAVVNKEFQLVTKSIVETELENVSNVDGLSFSWSSTAIATAANGEIMAITNDSAEKFLFIDQVWVGADIASQFKFGHVTAGASTGTAIIGLCINDDADKTAPATAFGNALVTGLTGFAAGSPNILAPANDTKVMDLEGAWIYGKDDTFYITAVTTGIYAATVIGHYHD